MDSFDRAFNQFIVKRLPRGGGYNYNSHAAVSWLETSKPCCQACCNNVLYSTKIMYYYKNVLYYSIARYLPWKLSTLEIGIPTLAHSLYFSRHLGRQNLPPRQLAPTSNSIDRSRLGCAKTHPSKLIILLTYLTVKLKQYSHLSMSSIGKP